MRWQQQRIGRWPAVLMAPLGLGLIVLAGCMAVADSKDPATGANTAGGQSEPSAGQTSNDKRDAPATPAAFLETRIAHYQKKLKDKPGDFTYQFELARLLHLKGAAGDKAAAKQAYQKLQSLHQRRPERAVVTSFLGGATLLAAKRQFFPWDKMDKLEKGKKLLNEAVEQGSDPFAPRVLRGIAAAHLPKSLGQREKARKDLKWAVQQAPERLKKGTVTPARAAAAHFHYGRLMQKQGEAKAAGTHWQRAQAIAPDSYAGLQAAQALKQAKGKNED